MSNPPPTGWHRMLEGYPWFEGQGGFPLPAYSEFMPPPRLRRRPYGAEDHTPFADDDPFGWIVPEVEEEYELQPGMQSLAQQIVSELAELGQGKPAHRIAGHQRRNLADNPYWPPELAARAGNLPHERYVTLLPLVLSKTQDDKARLRWTFFGNSEQGPERAFWQSFYSAPSQERPPQDGVGFLARLLSAVYGEPAADLQSLLRLGLRMLPTEPNPRFPYWQVADLPTWIQPLLIADDGAFDDVRYLLTFRPFSRLPAAARERYLAGRLSLLPFPGSLVFWGIPVYIKLQQELPLAMQLPLLRVAERHGGPSGIKVPQSGWMRESGRDYQAAQAKQQVEQSEVEEELLVDTYQRTSRWDRVRRYEDELKPDMSQRRAQLRKAKPALDTLQDNVARVLFGTRLDEMGLYGKPMARNSQIWTENARLLLDGPNATPEQLMQASEVIARGGNFRYRFLFPAMRVGLYEVYWHRPLVAYWSARAERAEPLADAPLGYLTAYHPQQPDLANPIELWPRLPRRDAFLWALRDFEHLSEHYAHQTALNILRVFDTHRRWGERPLPRSLARQVLRLAERESLEAWLAALPGKASNLEHGKRIRKALEDCLEPTHDTEPHTHLPGVPPEDLPPPITYESTATRTFEEAWWNDIHTLAHGHYINKDNADTIEDSATRTSRRELGEHDIRDLEAVGDHLLGRYRQAITVAGLEGQAVCGELPFHWQTDFDFSVFGGWKRNQEGRTYERDLLLMIPGRNRGEAVVMADHYDTAYMEDIYETSRGGSEARLSAAGADDNYSATSTLLQAAPIFLELSKQGRLERDVWLLHLTGEEFPSDCLGARHFCQALIEKTLHLHLEGGEKLNLSDVRVVGVYVLDMIGHNRENDLDDFQISPGRGRASLRLAWQAHVANALWNASAREWNERPERRGKGRGQRSLDVERIPAIAEHLRLQGEVRMHEDPRSSLFNTDGQIFSDCGVPVVLFMENYDISRKGYHDTKDTLENIDLDYGAAVAAIAIETVARVATLK